MIAERSDLPKAAPFATSHVATSIDPEANNTLWITMKKHAAGSCQKFELPLVHDLCALVNTIKKNDAHWPHEESSIPIHYAVLQSDHPDYFSLGGDLTYFRRCILEHDREALYRYCRSCLDGTYDWASLTNKGVTSIALVQGRALGGGFEMALAADFMIAEEHSQFGFPEIMFGLFPCSGGMSLLARRVGVHQADRMMTNVRIYSARELKEMGLVDEICPKGEGRSAVANFVAAHAKRRSARLMIQRSRSRVAPINYTELLTAVDEWMALAMNLGADELKVMEMLIKMQGGSN